MKILNINRLTALAVTVAAFTACTKADRSDDFPAGDIPATAGGFTSSSQIATSNLVAYWGFEGDLKETVSGTTGTNKGMTFSAGLKGQALQGAAPTNKAYATAVPSDAVKNLKAYTVSLWVNTPQNVGATGLVSIGHTTEFWANVNIFLDNGATGTAVFKTLFRNNNNMPANYQADNGTQTSTSAFNNWTNYVFTYDTSGVVRSYLNGSLITTKTGTPKPVNAQFSNIGPIVFGALHFMTVPSSTAGAGDQPWAGYLSGKLDEVRIYNKALTEVEVSALSILERRGN